MPEYNPLPIYCTQCGAPLTHRNHRVFCEYCGHIYRQPPDSPTEADHKEREENPPEEERPLSKQPFDPPYPPAEKIAAAPDLLNPAGVKQGNKGMDEADANALFTVVVIVLLFLLPAFFTTKAYISRNSKTRTTPSLPIATPELDRAATVTASRATFARATQTAARKATEEKPSLVEQIQQGLYAGVEYPSASNEDLAVANAVILEYADANTLIFSLFVYNQSGDKIDAASLTEHLEVTDLNLHSDRGDIFVCSLEKENWQDNTISNNEIRRKGVVTCLGNLSPQTASIVLDFEMPNWGSSHLQIPLLADPTDLQPDILLTLDEETCRFDISLYSQKPQMVWVKKSDIDILNDAGGHLTLDGCVPPGSQWEDGEYFLTLTHNRKNTQYPYNREMLTCIVDEPLPSEINIITATLQTLQKTFTSKGVINKSIGTIEFTNQTPGAVDNNM